MDAPFRAPGHDYNETTRRKKNHSKFLISLARLEKKTTKLLLSTSSITIFSLVRRDERAAFLFFSLIASHGPVHRPARHVISVRRPVYGTPSVIEKSADSAPPRAAMNDDPRRVKNTPAHSRDSWA